MIDVVFVAPNNHAVNYQGLADSNLSAIEPPTWALLLASSVISKGAKAKIIDTLAQNLTDQEMVARISELNPRLIVFVVYGQNVNAGTANMGGASRQAKAIKDAAISAPIVCIGSHVQALPAETLEMEIYLDIVVVNEGVKALEELVSLGAYNSKNLSKVHGIFYRDGDQVAEGADPIHISQAALELELPGYAWDLLPYRDKPLDLYRSPEWHADYQPEFRSPYAAIQTSIGCQFKCDFCMINLVNKNDMRKVSNAADYSGMRHWNSNFVMREIKKLIELGVRTIRITDEMFFLNRRAYVPIIDELIGLNAEDDLRLWAYARIDTVPAPEMLARIRKAGFRWLCLGIESGDKAIRLEVSKGKFEDVDVETVVRQIEEAGINVMANYIFGLPGDDERSIEETYKLSVKLNTLGWNTYAAMALPGSPLYVNSRNANQEMPKHFDEYSFHSKSCKPLSTEALPAWRILQLRDEKFVEYFGRKEFLDKIQRAFGEEARSKVFDSSRALLERDIINDAKGI